MIVNGHDVANINKSGYSSIMSCLLYCHNENEQIYDKIYHLIKVGSPLCKEGYDFTEFILIDYLWTDVGSSYSIGPRFFRFIQYLVDEDLLEKDLTKKKYRLFNPVNHCKTTDEVKWFCDTFKLHWGDIDNKYGYGCINKKKNVHKYGYRWSSSILESYIDRFFKHLCDASQSGSESEQYIVPKKSEDCIFIEEYDESNDNRLDMIKYILDKMKIYYGDKFMTICKDNNIFAISNILNKLYGDKILNLLLKYFKNDYFARYINDSMNDVFELYVSKLLRMKKFNFYRSTYDEHNHYYYTLGIQIKKNILFGIRNKYIYTYPVELIRTLGITLEEVVDPKKI